MKRLLLLFLLLIGIKANADQLQIITQAQAQQTESLFKNNGIRQVILFCGCCENETPIKVNIDRYYTKIYNASANEYEFVIEGHTEAGKTIKESVDLAYTYVKVGTLAECVGKVLSFECDPCSLPFEWSLKSKKAGEIEINNTSSDRLVVFVPSGGIMITQPGVMSAKVWVDRQGNITRYIILSATNEELKKILESKIREIKFNKLSTAPVEQNGLITIKFKFKN
ncbi:hypothetical protein [Edaphocola aurantiacus]|uniref:hypothetical protein n=1 Tax=Edaphocola aurantiacus TaxID=2601682 RepID=UPI001C9899A7|nr:hypothetical protein [Edaphocola aurantiacus]